MKEFSVTSGDPIADEQSTNEPPSFANVAIELIVPSRTNPRRTFDPAKLKELAASIASIGVMQPILLRPLPADRVEETSVKGSRKDKRPIYEIVSGERRWRASQEAGKTTIPAVVRAMGDEQVLEAQLVENLQRDDLHPMEEAEGYQRLCEATGIKKEDIAGKIGKSRTYVYNRLKLLTLTQESVEAFRAGKLDASRAELLATVADPKLQLKALKEFTEVGYNDRRKSVRECSVWLADNILLKIKDAPFDTKDETLVEGCGACSGCPKRTHSDRDLFAAFDGPDMCTDAPCYQGKAAAHLARIRVDAESKGMELIAGKEAKKLKPWAGSDNIVDHTKLSAKVETKNGEVTVASLIKDTDIKPVLFVDPHEPLKTVKIVPTGVLEQLLKDKGLIKETKSDQARKVDAAAEREREKREMQEEHRWRSIEAVSERIREGAIAGFSVPMLRMIAIALIEADDESDRDITLVRLWHIAAATDKHAGYAAHQERHLALMRHIQAVHDEAVAPMLLQIMLAREVQLVRHDPFTRQWGANDTPAITQLAEETETNLDAILTDIKSEFAEKRRAAKDAAKAAAQPDAASDSPPAGATSEAAPQGSVARGKGKSAKPKRAPKLSPEEAQLGIAEAMQGMEGPVAESDLPEHLGDDTIELLLMHGVATKAALQAMEVGELANLLSIDGDSAQELLASLQPSELPAEAATAE